MRRNNENTSSKSMSVFGFIIRMNIGLVSINQPPRKVLFKI